MQKSITLIQQDTAKYFTKQTSIDILKNRIISSIKKTTIISVLVVAVLSKQTNKNPQ